jgi:uncharacterized protein YbcI
MAGNDASPSVALAVSNAMSHLHREHYGRGPQSARTVVGHDHIIVFLENLHTPLDRTLRGGGEDTIAHEMRLAFQRAMQETFVSTVEELSGRKVRAFLSQHTSHPDISVEVFVLEPDAAHPAPEGIA